MTFSDLICPECKHVHEVKVINGEPCVESPAQPSMFVAFPESGWLSLSRVSRFQCQGKALGEVMLPIFDVPNEYFPEFVQYGPGDVAMFRPGWNMEGGKQTSTRARKMFEFWLSVIQAPYTGPYHVRKPWDLKVFDAVERLQFHFVAWRHLAILGEKDEIVDSWTEKMGLSICYEQMEDVLGVEAKLLLDKIGDAHKVVAGALFKLTMAMKAMVPQ